MTEAREGFGKHTRHNEQRGGHAGGNAEGQSRRSQEDAGSARQEHNERVLEDVRKELREETTEIHPDGKGYTRTIRIRNPGGGKPLSPEERAEVDAWLYNDSLPTKSARRRAWEEYRTSKLLGGLSVAEYLARNPDVDPDLFTADGRYLPYCRFGELRYDLKKLGKLGFQALSVENLR
jgi:hypothetical protein